MQDQFLFQQRQLQQQMQAKAQSQAPLVTATLFSKSCVFHPLPSFIIKQCTHLLLPTTTNIVNLYLRNGCMPTCLKSAVLSPRLKKPNTDFLQFKNFRPISNLKALSKIIEKSVALQLTNDIMNNNPHENFQSAYKVNHSTEMSW